MGSSTLSPNIKSVDVTKPDESSPAFAAGEFTDWLKNLLRDPNYSVYCPADSGDDITISIQSEDRRNKRPATLSAANKSKTIIPLHKDRFGQGLGFLKSLAATRHSERLVKSIGGEINVKDADVEPQSYRYQAVLSHRRQCIDLTLRPQFKPEKKVSPLPGPAEKERIYFPDGHGLTAHNIAYSHPKLLRSSVMELPAGLFLICGRTAVGKSNIAAELIRLILGNIRPVKQAQHLIITAEDPFEIGSKLRKKTPRFDGQPAWRLIERDLEYDGRLGEVLTDALRQSPSLVYVGELRKPRDFIETYRFAKTGHAVMATMHAGSISECFQTLFQNLGIRTSQDRGVLAETLYGIVHLRSATFSVGDALAQSGQPAAKNGLSDLPITASLPSCWWSAPISRKSLAVNGIGSLVPHFIAREDDDGTEGYYGHFHFALALQKEFALADKEGARQELQQKSVGDLREKLGKIFKKISTGKKSPKPAWLRSEKAFADHFLDHFYAQLREEAARRDIFS